MINKSFLWQIPTKIYFGVGEAKKINNRIKELGSKNVLIVTDIAIRNTGKIDEIEEQIKNRVDINIDIFDEVKPNPTAKIVEEGVKKAKNMEADLILAIGGGSSIDTGKAIALLMNNEEEIEYFWKNPPKNKSIPLIAVPTTAGTASEVTWVTVIKDTDKKVKMGIGSPKIAPTIAICDPLLTISMPKSVTVSTGLDALTHAIESYTNTITEPISESIALHAIYLIGKYLRAAYSKGDNIEARYNMLLASLMAGIAFANTKLGVVHAITSPMGGYFDVPHGVINAILLPYVMEYNLIGNIDKFAKVATALGENVDGLNKYQIARASVKAVKDLSKDVDLPKGLAEVGVKKEFLEEICEEAMKNVGIPINPRQPELEDLISICKAAM